MYWHTSERNQGQIVVVSQPQIRGQAEGEEGDGEGLTLRFDQSDNSWTIEDAMLGTIAEGQHGDHCPTVPEAIAIRTAKRKAKRRDA
jgi:hypothetical protein